ncbi:hypothetical protein EV2_002875 [Malus domestica]
MPPAAACLDPSSIVQIPSSLKTIYRTEKPKNRGGCSDQSSRVAPHNLLMYAQSASLKNDAASKFQCHNLHRALLNLESQNDRIWHSSQGEVKQQHWNQINWITDDRS